MVVWEGVGSWKRTLLELNAAMSLRSLLHLARPHTRRKAPNFIHQYPRCFSTSIRRTENGAQAQSTQTPLEKIIVDSIKVGTASICQQLSLRDETYFLVWSRLRGPSPCQNTCSSASPTPPRDIIPRETCSVPEATS